MIYAPRPNHVLGFSYQQMVLQTSPLNRVPVNFTEMDVLKRIGTIGTTIQWKLAILVKYYTYSFILPLCIFA